MTEKKNNVAVIKRGRARIIDLPDEVTELYTVHTFHFKDETILIALTNCGTYMINSKKEEPAWKKVDLKKVHQLQRIQF